MLGRPNAERMAQHSNVPLFHHSLPIDRMDLIPAGTASVISQSSIEQ